MDAAAISTGAGLTGTNKLAGDRLRGVGIDDFLNLIITELQNQDPLEPSDNGQLLQQLSQIREIEATSQLSETLEAVLLSQNLASASRMVGQFVRGLSTSGQEVAGTVDSVSIQDGKPMLRIGEHSVGLDSVREIANA